MIPLFPLWYSRLGNVTVAPPAATPLSYGGSKGRQRRNNVVAQSVVNPPTHRQRLFSKHEFLHEFPQEEHKPKRKVPGGHEKPVPEFQPDFARKNYAKPFRLGDDEEIRAKLESLKVALLQAQQALTVSDDDLALILLLTA